MPGKTGTRSWMIGAILTLCLLVAGCSGTPKVLTVGMGEPVTLGIGQSARIAGEDLVITFDEVTADSRCPQGVVCIWAGEARSHITIRQGGTPHRLVLVQPGSSERAKATFRGYTIIHSLSPYPAEGREITPDQYRLTLTVTK